MSRPIVAIVGRPNVGKSTLFNRILGWRKAIVDSQSGLTRDRLYGVAEWAGREFTIVDTAGLDMDSAKDESRAAIEGQTKVAIDQADVIVLLLDVREGLTAIDREIVRLLRRSGRRVLVAANKADSPNDRHFAHEILELGFDEPNLISAQHGLGIGDFLDRVIEQLPEPSEEPAPDSKADRLAIMGRPNVGKSSLLNALLGDERALVSPIPGTTRDPVDTELVYDGVPVVLIDTAGIRRKSTARDQLERYSLLRGIHAMERADVVLLVLDGSAGVLAQDQHVAGYALEAGKGLVIVVNKIDLVEPAMRKAAYWRTVLRRAGHAQGGLLANCPYREVQVRPVRADRDRVGEDQGRHPAGDPGRARRRGQPADQDPAQRAESRLAPGLRRSPAAELQRPPPEAGLRHPGGFRSPDRRDVRERCRAAPLLLPAIPREGDQGAVRAVRQPAEAGPSGRYGQAGGFEDQGLARLHFAHVTCTTR